MVREKDKPRGVTAYDIRRSGRNFWQNLWIGEEREYFIENLSLLLTSGMNIASVVGALRAEMRSSRMQKVIGQLARDIDEGMPLSRALQRTHLLPAHVISLIKIGEESGRLSENLKVVVAEREKDRIFRSKVRSAMMYPILVLTLTVVIGVAVAWFVLPRLATVFAELQVELPVITKALISLGKFLGGYGSIVIPFFFLVLGGAVYLLFISPRTKFVGQVFIMKFPGVRRLIQEVEIARFGYILGTLLEAGLPVVDALSSLEEATTFRAYERLYAHLAVSVGEGNSFERSLRHYPRSKTLIPLPIQQMIAAAERSGHLPETLKKVSEIYEARTETTTKNLVVILEPILLVIVWLGVVAVALAIILPIYSLIGGLNQ